MIGSYKFLFYLFLNNLFSENLKFLEFKNIFLAWMETV